MLMTISDERMILDKAHKLLKDSGIKAFPFKIKPVITYLQKENDLQVVKYSTVADGMDITLKTVGSMVGSDEATLVYHGPDSPTFIYYKDTDIPKERIRWNLCHEVAHFCCGHHLIQYRLKQEGLEMSKTAAARIEAEANTFTRNMHAPLELVFAFMEYYNLYDTVGVFSILRCIFRLSIEAAYYYTGQIFDRRTQQLVIQGGITDYDEFLKEFTGMFDRYNFGPIVYRYQQEYDSFKRHLDRRTTLSYRKPYQESFASIVERVAQQEIESLNLNY